MSDEDRPTEPPDPNTTAADVLRSLGQFKKDLFRHLDEQETRRNESIDVKLDNRDENVLAHFEEIRDDLRELSSKLPEISANVKDLKWWRGEFRRNRHGIRNAFLAVIGAIGELKRRLDKVDGLGSDVSELNDMIVRALKYENNDTERAPPPDPKEP